MSGDRRGVLVPVARGAAACHDPVVAPAPLIGRDEDVARLRDAVVSARAAEPQCVLVTGEAGIGKSRLVREALAGIDDALVVTGHGADMATGEIPFGVLADTLRDLLHGAGTDVLTSTERASLAPLLPGSVPSGHIERVQVLSAVLDVLERLSTERLLVWVVEDLHWADTATRDLLNLAVRTLRGRLLVIATVRTDDHDRPADAEAALTSYVAGLARLPGTTMVPLSRLNPDEVRLQLRGLLGPGLAAGTASRIEALSDGVPFVVEELAAARGRPEIATASGAAAGRLAGLSADARRLVEAAAVGEGHLRIGLLEEVVDATADELDTALAEAVRAGVLTTDHATDAVGFRHALLREAAERELGPGARRSWHRRWAEVLQDHPGLLAADPAALAIAEHWHHARDVRRALAASIAAMPAAERICRPEEETVLWTRVMRAYDVLDDAPEVTGLSMRDVLGRAMLAAFQASVSVRHEFRAAIPSHRLSPAERLWRALLVEKEAPKGESNQGAEGPTIAVADAFEDSPPDLVAVEVWADTGSRLVSDPERGRRLVARAMDGARALHNPRAILSVAALGSYQVQVNGDPLYATSLIRTALAECGEEYWASVVSVLGNLTWCELIQGNHEAADAAATDALERLAHPHLTVRLWEHVAENATATWLLTGQWQRARILLEEAAPWWEDDCRTSNARQELLELLQRGATGPLTRWGAHLDHPAAFGAPRALVRELLARAAIAHGETGEMRAVLAAAWDDEYVLLSDDQLWSTALVGARAEADAVLAGASDDSDEALTHLSRIVEVTARFRRYGALGEVWPLDLAAQLERFHGRDARSALRAALAGWERIGHVPDVGVTHLALAEQEAIHGDRGAAREHLAAAREIATRLDARPMLDRADILAERFALASHERRTTDLLTGRESEVLALVAEGRTNAEIAATLFMSPKTASVHVSHIIAKLGAANRTEAAATARRQGLLQ